MKTQIDTAAAEWFLASGTKKVGPMTEARVLERLAAGKVPAKARAWREGMNDWVLVSELPQFSGDAPTRVEKPVKPAKSSSGERALARSAERERAAFRQPYRIERADLWRAFELGFDPARVKVALAALGAALAILVVTAGALWIHWALGLIALLGTGPALLVTGALLLGALSYQTRRRIEGAPTPGPAEAFGFAKKNLLALVASPILTGLIALVPPVLLLVKSAISHVPAVGGAAAGLTFGIDLALSASLIFVAVAASLAWHLVPSIVAFEETGVVATVRTLLATVVSRVVRLLLWPTRPLAALGATTFGLGLIALVAIAVPALLNSKALGVSFAPRSEPAPRVLETPDLDAPAPRFDRPMPKARTAPPTSPMAGIADLAGSFRVEPTVGLAGVLFWSAVLMAIVGSVVVSTANALAGLLYLGCRPGNDDLVTRADYLRQVSSAEAPWATRRVTPCRSAALRAAPSTSTDLRVRHDIAQKQEAARASS